jgi:glycosyltransferase involved in cell wall biosynthesis
VTVVVPVKDRRERMLRCLDALLALEYPNYDVLVLDNCSSDGTAEACRERAREARVPVRVEVLDGSVGKLRNRAAELSDADLLAYTDSDCMPAPGWLAAGTWPFRDRPRLGVVQGTTLPEHEPDGHEWHDTQEITSWTGRYECCNLIVRREALKESTGFDEQLWVWEDTAGGLAIREAGWDVAFVAEALVRHDVTYPGWRYWARRSRRYGNVAKLVRRHPGARRELLWGRLFLRPRDARLLAAVAGVLLSPVARPFLLLALPYVWERHPGSLHPLALRATGRAVLVDLSVLEGMLRGSLRYRRLVL